MPLQHGLAHRRRGSGVDGHGGGGPTECDLPAPRKVHSMALSGEERPAYWDDCEAMSFGELREFIDRGLDAIQEDDPGEELPREREEFMALADVLETKIAEARAEMPPVPPAPELPPGYDPDIPSYSRGSFYPSSELSEMEWELWRLEGAIERARYDHEIPGWRYDHMRQEARTLRLRIGAREDEERQSWPARYAAHEKVRPGYELAVRRRNEEVRRINKRLGVLDRHRGFAERIRRKINTTFGTLGESPTGRLRWRPFESAEPTPANIWRHYQDRLRRSGTTDEFDQRRLDAATALPYVDW